MTSLQKFRLMAAAAVTVTAAVSAPAAANVLTFEDINDFNFVPEGHGGLSWGNFLVLDATAFLPSGYKNGRVSGDKVVFNGGGSSASIAAVSGTFSLKSGFFTAAWSNGLNIRIDGYTSGSSPAFTKTLVVHTDAPAQQTFDWSNLTSVRFESFGGQNAGFQGFGSHFAMDNLELGAAIPEPATWAMMIGGFGATGVAMRRKQKLRVSYATA